MEFNQLKNTEQEYYLSEILQKLNTLEMCFSDLYNITSNYCYYNDSILQKFEELIEVMKGK